MISELPEYDRACWELLDRYEARKSGIDCDWDNPCVRMYLMPFPARLELEVCAAVYELTTMTPDEWRQLSQAERTTCIRKLIDMLKPRKFSLNGPEQKAVSNDLKPRKLLTGWHEITDALEMRHADRRQIASLNDRCEGPIRNQGKGTRPFVYFDELIDWWNKMDLRQNELANQQKGRKLSAETQHNYGATGKVVPEMAGGVKKRREIARTRSRDVAGARQEDHDERRRDSRR